MQVVTVFRMGARKNPETLSQNLDWIKKNQNAGGGIGGTWPKLPVPKNERVVFLALKNQKYREKMYGGCLVPDHDLGFFFGAHHVKQKRLCSMCRFLRQRSCSG